MRSIIVLGVLPVVAFVLFKLASFINLSRRRAIHAKRLNCKPAPIFPSRDGLGIGNLLELLRMATSGKFLQCLMNRGKAMTEQEGRPVTTYKMQFLRTWIVMTTDPKNIQAILATQFHDFELGPVRTGTFTTL